MYDESAKLQGASQRNFSPSEKDGNPRIIQNKIKVLRNLVDINLNTDLIDSINHVSSRLSAIGMRLNPQEHPTNKLPKTTGSDQLQDRESIPPQGMAADLDMINENGSKFLSKFNGTIAGINELLSYIEDHI